MTKRQNVETAAQQIAIAGYSEVLTGVAELLESARRTAARASNAIMTATYWEIGRRIVEYEQGGKERAGYGQALLARLSNDLRATPMPDRGLPPTLRPCRQLEGVEDRQCVLALHSAHLR